MIAPTTSTTPTTFSPTISSPRVQYSTVQYSTVQYSTVQYSTFNIKPNSENQSQHESTDITMANEDSDNSKFFVKPKNIAKKRTPSQRPITKKTPAKNEPFKKDITEDITDKENKTRTSPAQRKKTDNPNDRTIQQTTHQSY